MAAVALRDVVEVVDDDRDVDDAGERTPYPEEERYQVTANEAAVETLRRRNVRAVVNFIFFSVL
jgi:hypothetical protein